MSGIPASLYWNLDVYPQRLERADQWGEHGWVYDVAEDAFYRYELDRKCQTDRVSARLARDEMLARYGTGHPLGVWVRRLELFVTDDARYLWRCEPGTLTRYGGVEPDARGRPRQNAETRRAARAPRSGEDAARLFRAADG